MVLLAAALGAFWLGHSFAGYPLVAHTEEGTYVYGNCHASSDSGCAPPLQLQDRTTCERNVVALDVVPRRVHRVRGAAIAADYERGATDVGTSHTTTTIFANTDRLAHRAARAMRRRGERRPGRLAAPVYPIAVLKELKRVLAAARTPESLQEVSRYLGMRPGVVRARLRVARLLPPGALAHVPVPRRSWAQVQHDRQIAFAAETHEAQQRFGLTRAQVRAAVKRVRGLTGSC